MLGQLGMGRHAIVAVFIDLERDMRRPRVTHGVFDVDAPIALANGHEDWSIYELDFLKYIALHDNIAQASVAGLVWDG